MSNDGGGGRDELRFAVAESGEELSVAGALVGEGGGIREVDGAVSDERIERGHATEAGGLLERREEFAHGEMIMAIAGVGLGRRRQS